MLQLQSLKNEDLLLLEIVTKGMIKELLQTLKSITNAKSNLANLNEYKSNKQFFLDIINLDQVKDRRLIVSGIYNFLSLIYIFI